MFARVTCPACQYKDSIPEGEMGLRRVCPNCKTPFLAGKAVADADVGVPMKYQPATDPTYNKTMLGDSQPPISYNCPRCKKPLESPASEAGLKKPCPACGQRLQVPAAPPPAAPQPNLNKTMLAADDRQPQPPIRYNCPNCKKPMESPASEAGTKKNCPACGQRFQVPAAPPPAASQPNLNKTILASDESQASPYGMATGRATTTPSSAMPLAAAGPTASPNLPTWLPKSPWPYAAGFGAFLLVFFIIPAFIRGGKQEDTAAIANLQRELDKLKAEAEQKKAEMERTKLFEAEQRKQFEELISRQKAQEDKVRDEFRQLIRSVTDQKAREDLQEKLAEKTRQMEEERRAAEAKKLQFQQETAAKLEALQKALEQSQQKQQTIIQQPPPVIYYPPYHPGYYRPWWW